MLIKKASKIYGEGWTVKSIDPIDNEDLTTLEPNVEVVPSDWGISFKFVIRQTKGYFFIPADKDTVAKVGSFVPLKDIILVTLEKPGREDITRIRLK